MKLISLILFSTTLLWVGSGTMIRSQQDTDQALEKSNQSKQDKKTEHAGDQAEDKRKSRRYSHKKYSNVVYSRGREYRLLCDIYKPLGSGPFPAVLAIHGGAWSHGSKLQMMLHAPKLAGAGYVVVAINYRLAPEHKFPAQVHDCKHAVRWIRSNCEKLNVNPRQIAVFGYSAGGHLSAMLGTTDSSDELDGVIHKEHSELSSRVQCVVVGGGPCEFEWIKSKALVHWLGESPDENPDLYFRAAPISYVSKDDPPFIFFHGSDDRVVPPSSSQKMHEQLLSTGIESRYESINDKGHLATFSDASWVETAIEFMDEKLNRAHYD